MKIMQMTINIISLFLTLSAWDMNFQLMMIFDASGLTVFTIFLIYYQERHEKFAFLKVF